MRIKIKAKSEIREPGTRRTRFAFAWLPEYIDDNFVWFESYLVAEELRHLIDSHHGRASLAWIETERFLDSRKPVFKKRR